MAGSTEVPAGWYPDPTGRHQYRYWHGTGWTDTVGDDGRTSSDPPVLAPAVATTAGYTPPLAPTPARRSTKWWLIPIAIVSALLLVAGGGVWVTLTRPGPSPVGLAAMTVTSRSTSLAWLPPRTGRTPQTYLVRRNGVEITRISAQTSYIDTGLAPLTDYRYRVQGIVDGRTSSPTTEIVVHTLPESPYGLTRGAVTMTSVVVTWSAPSGPRPDTYLVMRNGTQVGSRPGDTLSYQDSSLTPASDATYTVIAVTRGVRSDPAPNLTVSTEPPPIPGARLARSWDVTLTVTKSTSSRAKVGLNDTGNWLFTPKCPAGACAVAVSGDMGGHPFSITLNRSGATYQGSGTGHIASCVNKDIANNLTLSLDVVAGEMSDGVWSASNWRGSLTLSIPYTTAGTYYCPAQSITFAVSPDQVTADPTT
jgi:hypothetical protein